jgi:hypothetical protein
MISLPRSNRIPREGVCIRPRYKATWPRPGHLEGLIDEPMVTGSIFAAVHLVPSVTHGAEMFCRGPGLLNLISTRGMTGAYRPETIFRFAPS